MIVQISGTLIKKDINTAIIEANGLGYLCFISNNTFNQLFECIRVDWTITNTYICFDPMN